MKALKIVILMAAVAIGFSSCIVPVPVGGRPGYRGGPVYRGGRGYHGGPRYHQGPGYNRGGGYDRRSDRGPRHYR